jgi:hypothetical protein
MGLIGLDYAEVRHAASEMGLTFSGSLKRKIKALERKRLESQTKDSGNRAENINQGTSKP